MKRRHIFLFAHPAVTFLYLALAIGSSMLVYTPCFVAASFLCGSVYSIYLSGIKRYAASLKYMLILFIMISAAVPLTNPRGLTVLFHLFDNPVTLESLLFGVCTGGVFVNVILWFSVYHALMTSDKFMFLFGRAAPTLALMLSMILRLIPEASARAQTISAAQTALCPQAKTKRQRLIQKLDETTLLMSWMMESSLETAASMRARAFGKTKRASSHMFHFSSSDFISAVLLTLLGAASVYAMYRYKFAFYPRLAHTPPTVYAVAVYAGLLLFPLICEGKERLLWALAK